MLKTVATKIAHNSTIPSLAGNSDLRPLQDLINAEKSVLTSLQRLSVDFSRASEALRTWGLGEGDDLGDTLSASAVILSHFSSALSQYASHGHRMRDQLKAIRTREEALDDLKRRRKSVMSSADSADKKLSKMGPEHKNLEQQQETLNRLRNEIRSLDADILAEEASLGDFKRTQVKTMMGLKFGGLLECCEKGIIAGDCGKFVVAEIPEEVTPPGVPRSIYYGHPQTEQLVAEAHRAVSEVILSTTTPLRQQNQGPYTQDPQPELGPWVQNDATGSPNSQRLLATTQDLEDGRFLDSSSSFKPLVMSSQQSSRYELKDGLKRRSIEEFGTSVWSSPGESGSRFNTYPPRIGPAADVDGNYKESPVLHSRHEAGPSFSSSVSDALSTIGGPLGTDANARASEDYPAPPSYVAQEEDTNSRLESGYGNLTAPGQRLRASEGDIGGATRRQSEEEERALDAAAARQISREMEALDFSRGRSGSLPQSVHSTMTDELPSNLPTSGVNVSVSIEREPSPLLPPAPPFSKHSISPRPSYERLPINSSSPSQNHPPSYERTSPDIPPLSTRFNKPSSGPPSPRINRKPISSRPSFEQSSSSSGGPPSLPKISTSSLLPPGGKTISAAAFKRAIPRKESAGVGLGDGRVQSPIVAPSPLDRANSDSRPLPTVPYDELGVDGNTSTVWNDGSGRSQNNYNSGRFVTNLENEWK